MSLVLRNKSEKDDKKMKKRRFGFGKKKKGIFYSGENVTQRRIFFRNYHKSFTKKRSDCIKLICRQCFAVLFIGFLIFLILDRFDQNYTLCHIVKNYKQEIYVAKFALFF